MLKPKQIKIRYISLLTHSDGKLSLKATYLYRINGIIKQLESEEGYWLKLEIRHFISDNKMVISLDQTK